MHENFQVYSINTLKTLYVCSYMYNQIAVAVCSYTLFIFPSHLQLIYETIITSLTLEGIHIACTGWLPKAIKPNNNEVALTYVVYCNLCLQSN